MHYQMEVYRYGMLNEARRNDKGKRDVDIDSGTLIY